MRNKKKETQVLCPKCGTEFAIAKNEFTTVATVIGQDSGLRVIFPAVVEKKAAAVKLPKTGEARIEALRKAGVDVSNLFAMRGADGKEHVASDRNGMLTILKDNDPIFDFIITQGTVPNSRLFRRWVMAQMFHMMTYMPYRSHEPVGVTQMIHDLGYEYQWKMLMDELNAQMKMSGRDQENFADRNRWFNVDVVVKMATDYLLELKKRVDALKTRKCKGIPYKRIGSRDIFVKEAKDSGKVRLKGVSKFLPVIRALYPSYHMAVEQTNKLFSEIVEMVRKIETDGIHMGCSDDELLREAREKEEKIASFGYRNTDYFRYVEHYQNIREILSTNPWKGENVARVVIRLL